MSEAQTEQAIESPVETAPVLEDPVILEQPTPEPAYQPDINATIRDTIRESMQQTQAPVLEESEYQEPVSFDKDQIKKEILAEIQAEQHQQNQYQQTIQTAMKESTDEYNGYLGRMDNSLKNFGIDLTAPENAFLNRHVDTVLEKEFFKKQNEVGRPILTRQEMRQVTANHWAQVKEVIGQAGVDTTVKISTPGLSPAARANTTIQPARPTTTQDLVAESLNRIKSGENLSSAELYKAYNEHRRRGRTAQ